MPVLRFKPNKIEIQTIEPGHEDEHGNYYEGVHNDWKTIDCCDCVPAAGGEGEIKFGDGIVSKYSYTIYLPSNCIELHKGDKVRIHRYGTVTESVIKGFIRYQHQCKAWA